MSDFSQLTKDLHHMNQIESAQINKTKTGVKESLLDSVLSLKDCDLAAKRIFALGIGAQRSGTTWVGKYLDMHPDFLCSPIKELHVFDSLFIRPNDILEKGFAERYFKHSIDFRVKNPSLEQIDLLMAEADRVALPKLDGGYFRFFDKRLKQSHLSFGEITPEYALLKSSILHRIATSHDNVRIFYILRRPEDRYISALHYWARLRPEFKPSESLIEGLKRTLFTRYSDYHITIQELKKAGASDRLFICFYEEVFGNPDYHLAKLCDFIGIAYIKPSELGLPINRKVNAPNKEPKEELPAEAIEAICSRFRPVYNELPRLINRDLPKEWTTSIT